MVEKWDSRHEPMEARIIPPLQDEADEPPSRLGALMFVFWSVFMMLLGAMIALMWQGHIVFR